MVTLELFDVRDADRLERALEIRRRVFVAEQHVPLELEIDEHDRTDLATVHVLASRGSRSVGTGRFCMAGPGTAQVGRLAVLPEERGTGVGGALLEALVAEAARRGFARVHLYAQVQATGFYRKAGFYDDGPPLWDAGILHQPMSKALGG